ncbi:ABC transporter substrate-binding protein [Nocardiopsis trehalosi]|uniref:ABC transporter substrate-binding protein n=1 Tax=Nocardiopsis trehalosi TaxID=109329 RepID=UPI000A5C4A59|nr:ABC transporter substrate-binding protein [Nocardiopsis trehalosi]
MSSTIQRFAASAARRRPLPSWRRGGAVERVSRRSVLLGAGGVAALAAVGCGPAQEGPAAEGPARTVAHRYGETEVSGSPSRVVTVGLTEQDYVLALGVAPVGVREWFGGHEGALWPWAREALGGEAVPEVLPVDALNYEQVAALEPDLILGVNSGLTREEYDLLAAIAPTIAQPDEYADFGAPWQEVMRVVGVALGREDDAEAIVADIEERFERVRADHPEFAESTALLASSIEGEAFAYAEGPAPGFLVQLGFELPEDAAALFTDANRAPQQVSLEEVEVLQADVLLMGVYGADGSGVLEEGVFTALDVSREGRVLAMPEMSRLNGALSFGSVLSLPYALEEMEPRLVALLDGDPETEADPVE